MRMLTSFLSSNLVKSNPLNKLTIAKSFPIKYRMFKLIKSILILLPSYFLYAFMYAVKLQNAI